METDASNKKVDVSYKPYLYFFLPNLLLLFFLNNKNKFNKITCSLKSLCPYFLQDKVHASKHLKELFRKIQYVQPCFPNRYQVLADVAGNSNDHDVTIEKEIINEQELDRLSKETNGKTDKRKVSNLKKKVVILGDSIVKQVNGWQLSKPSKNEKASVYRFVERLQNKC